MSFHHGGPKGCRGLTPIIIHEARAPGWHAALALARHTWLPCPDPASSDAALPGISETHFQRDGRIHCAIAPPCEQYPSPEPSRTSVHVSPPKYAALQLHFRHAIQVLSLVGGGYSRFLGLPPPLRDMLLPGVRSAVPSSQRLLSIGSDGTSAPLSASRLLAPVARACISVKRRINPSN